MLFDFTAGLYGVYFCRGCLGVFFVVLGEFGFVVVAVRSRVRSSFVFCRVFLGFRSGLFCL